MPKFTKDDEYGTHHYEQNVKHYVCKGTGQRFTHPADAPAPTVSPNGYDVALAGSQPWDLVDFTPKANGKQAPEGSDLDKIAKAKAAKAAGPK